MSTVPVRRLLLVLTLLLGFGLRCYHLGFQSFWGDEGSTAAMARRGVADIIQRSANDISPPGYYLLYRGWAALVGDSEFASRYISVIASVATIALTYALGRRIAGRQAGLIAALASALSAYAVYYAQETRMYALLTALGLASWAALLALDGPRPRRATLAYILLSLAILFTQYFGIAILIAQNLAWLVATLWRRRWQATHWLRWAAIQATIGIAFLPWFLHIRQNLLGWSATSVPVTPAFMLRELTQLVTVGPTPVAVPMWTAIFGAVVLVGVVAGWRAANGEWRMANGGNADALDGATQDADSVAVRSNVPTFQRSNVPAFIALVPPLLMLLISQQRPFWNPKFLLMALPGFHLLFGQGVAALGRWLPSRVGRVAVVAVTALLLLVAAVPPLRALYFDPATWRDDYRAIAQTIAAQATPDDAVLLVGPGQVEIYDYYGDDKLIRYPLPTMRPLVADQTERTLDAIIAAHPNLFVIWWAEQENDPASIIPRYLARHAFPLGSRWYGNVRLERFSTVKPEPPVVPPTPVTFKGEGAELVFEGAMLGPLTLPAGQGVTMTAAWHGVGPLPPLTLFAQLLDAGGNVIGQYDGTGGTVPSTAWGDGQQITHLGVPIPVGTPPGDYALIVGAYRSDDGVRLLPADGGDAIRLATIHVIRPATAPPLAALALHHGEGREATFGDITLVGAAANRLGSDHAPDTPLIPGDPLAVRLIWQAQREAPQAPPLMLRLLRADGSVAAEWGWEPTEQRHPLSAWQAGELVRDPQRRTLPADLAAGRYTLVLDGGERRVTVGLIEVSSR